jgi:hypothetical protein
MRGSAYWGSGSHTSHIHTHTHTHTYTHNTHFSLHSQYFLTLRTSVSDPKLDNANVWKVETFPGAHAHYSAHNTVIWASLYVYQNTVRFNSASSLFIAQILLLFIGLWVKTEGVPGIPPFPCLTQNCFPPDHTMSSEFQNSSHLDTSFHRSKYVLSFFILQHLMPAVGP